MVDISVSYMGLKLKTPFIAASSAYTADLEKIVAMAKSGIGAVVLKSIFEEQINNEAGFLEETSSYYPENWDFLHRYLTDYSVGKYVQLIKDAKRESGVPVIASINCFSHEAWVGFAKEIEKAGADALEVNIYSLPLNAGYVGGQMEQEYFNIIHSITKSVKIPVAVKIGEQFTSLGNFVSSLQGYGASAAVLFNRFYTPDISLKKMQIVPASPFSGKMEYLRELRWIAILSSFMRNFDLSASTGVYDPSSAIKLILAGAKTVQLCSVMYKQGLFVASDFVQGITEFMQKKGFGSISDFRGMLNYSNIPNPQGFERIQFLHSRTECK